MGERQLLIVGIDPGTTLGYAAIDFNGGMVKVSSEKNLDMSSLISRLIKLGKPLIVASDKQYNPESVDKLAIKLGARVISPDYDLKVNEKRELVEDFKTNNQHEVDALASAFFAFKKIGSLLKKINIFVEHYNKENIKRQLIEFVVGKGLNIKDAAEIIEEPEKEEIKVVKEVIEEKKLTEKEFLSLYKKFKEAKRDILLLKRQNSRLKEQMAAIRKDYEYMFKQISKSQSDKKMRSLLDFKEKRIMFFDRELKKREDEIKSMQNDVTTLIYFLSNINSSVLLKKLDNLGLKEFEKKKNILNIKEKDILLVKDPDIVSEKTIEFLKDKVDIIIYKKPVSKKIESKLPFLFIDAKYINIEEDEYFGIVNKEEFIKIKNKKGLLSKIVEDYRKSKI